tara:strand:- start:13 stop:621 length:609 start_codon:yes stop_codon:yes gene_type:complete
MSEVKAIIFDMGGVILNAKIESAYEILSKNLGIEKTTFDAVRNKYIKDAQKGEISTDDFLDKICSELNLEKSNLKKLWEQAYSEVMVLDQKVLDLAKSLKATGYKIALITNTIEIHSNINKSRGIYNEFNPAILSTEAHMLKPNKEIYQLMLERLNLQPSECIFIDDREEHILPATELGIPSILFKNLSQLKDSLKEKDIKF